ncbi:predicted protein [Uncinocarpus reesii 1704]|uniref:Nitrogen regulatory protein areA GATA-like domain-containing protein n=1 Tax=Uncinocarpus reesii (strain UAMH 1704) TaxID=336963 RepID=C4JLL8_UNCRE|nr:uncharacterized protein UREG_03726 [Uncinocarpus reesii 1704]EEP78880.1 predicted protein [Uncinocarpus reesii 1704]
MADALPHGLVSTTERVSSDLESADHVEIEDVAKLWRVYTNNKITLKQGAGRRLENLFWRVWSNGRISSNISGSTLARLFMQLTDETPLWTKAKEELDSIPRSPLPKFPQPTPALHSPAYSGTNKNNPKVHQSSNNYRSCSRMQPPPSILKKPSRSSSQNTRKSTRFTFEGLEQPEEVDIWKNFRSPPRWAEHGPNCDSDLRLKAAAMNARAAQSPVGPVSPKTVGNPRPPKPPLPVQHASRPLPNYPLFDDSPGSPTATEKQLSPKAKTPQPLSRPKPTTKKPAEPFPTIPLVEKDFRTRFVERQPRESRVSSLTSLISSDESLSLSISPASINPLLLRPGRQIPRTADSMHPDILPAQPPEALLSRTLSSSPTNLISSHENLQPPIRRSKQSSQLSKLIEEEKRTKEE